MDSSELRQKFLSFFQQRGHTVIPSASLIPGDATVLFTTAGMQPLVPFLLGEAHPRGKRLVNYQKCLRTDDIEEVGDDTHLTFFEMLGNWSLGDYWKKESIAWSFEFLTKELQIPVEKLAVSCFEGDEHSVRDTESAEIWKSLGIPGNRIVFLPKADNWWGPVGPTGPCGPDTEIFYWKNNDVPAPETFDPADKNWVEIWNNVFMQYVKMQDGSYVPAEQKNVDTGMGLERIVAVLNGKQSVYDTDLFESIIHKIEELSGKKYQDFQRNFRIVADHLKSAVFLVGEGIAPGRYERDYVLRKLIRRAVRYGMVLEISDNSLDVLVTNIVNFYKNLYPEIGVMQQQVFPIILQEANKFRTTLEKSLKELYRELSVYESQDDPKKLAYIKEKLSKLSHQSEVTSSVLAHKGYGTLLEAEPIYVGVIMFYLYQEGGYPVELAKEELMVSFPNINFADVMQVFDEELTAHKNLSRTASAGMFKGGLADHAPETVKLHTAHHLLLAALQNVLGPEIKQRGSNITAERLRLDFSFDRKMADGEKKKTEDLVNEKIREGLRVVKREMAKEEAEKIGAQMEFGVKYGNTVLVYFIEDGKGNVFSKEFCGGPHVENTAELGLFKIVKEESVSRGVRRIKAVLLPK